MTSIHHRDRRPLPPVHLPADPYADDATAEAERQQLPAHFHAKPADAAEAQAARAARATVLVPYVTPHGEGWVVPSCKTAAAITKFVAGQ